MLSIARSAVFLLLFALSFATQALENNAENTTYPTLRVFTNTHPPYSYVDHRGKPVGIATDRVRAFLDRAGVPYEITVVGWKRALQSTSLEKNTLIYSLNRIPERENQFHWIMPLNVKKLSIYIRNDDLAPQDIPSLVRGGYRAVCNMGSSQCEFFEKLKMPERSVMAVPALPVGGQINLLLGGRADLMLADKAVVAWYIGQGSVGADALKSLGEIDVDVLDYLAAGRNMDDRLLDALLSAAQDKEPPLETKTD